MYPGKAFIIIFLIFATLLALNIFVWGPPHEPRVITYPPVEVKPYRGTSIDT